MRSVPLTRHTHSPPSALASPPDRFILVAAIFSVVLSLSGTVGLIAGQRALLTWVPGGRGMVLDTALAILLTGTGLCIARRQNVRLLRGIAGSLLLLASLNLLMPGPRGILQHLCLPPDPAMQMSLASIAVFLLAGSALLLLSRTNPSLLALWGVALLGALITGTGLITLLGYASGLQGAPWWSGFFLHMAVPTAVACCVLGSGLIAFCFRMERSVVQRFSLTLAVSTVMGLLLLLVGVHAVSASSDAVAASELEIPQLSADILLLETLVQDVRKAETGQRGYLLTGDRQYLNAFEVGRAGFLEIVRNNPGLDARLIETMRLKLAELNRTIVLENQGQHTQALRLVKTSAGWRLMEDIDAQALIIGDRLRAKRRLRVDESGQSFSAVRKTIVGSSGMALLFAISALLLVGTEMSRRSRVEFELRENEASLREQTLRAEDANRAKSSFLASMSHEIRTPMNAILGMADMLWESDLSQTQRHYVEIFRRAGGNLLALINDILDLSKIESGNFSVETVDFDLQETVEHLIEILTPKARSKLLTLNIHIAPGTATGLIGDPLRVQQILLNLLGNAIKFTERGEVSLKVCSRNSETQADLEFEIADTGIGIPANKLSSIFEDFTQAESSTTRRFGGTGLGLGISRRLIRQMGGDLRVQSEVGRGSTFSFSLLLPISSEHRNLSPVEFDEMAGRRVLIVENDQTDRAVMTEMCAAWGMLATACDSGAGAVELVKKSVPPMQFELVLVDRMMPGIEGFETARQIRALDPTIAILIVSSDARSGDSTRCRELGYSGQLQKPVRRAALLRHIVKALGGGVSVPAALAGSRENSKEIAQPAKRIRVLAAEDSEDNRFLLQAYCNGTAYEPTFAENGERAVAAYRAARFDLVVMDVQMPVMDGLTATREIRTIEAARGQARTPILAITADALPEDVTRALQAGCDAHLAKPISKRTFLKALDQWRVPPPSAVSPALIEIPEGLEELARNYLASRRLELPILEGMLERSDFEGLRRLAHNLKGTGGGYGFQEITRLGSSLEQASKDRDLTDLSGQLMELSAYLQAADKQLHTA
jgi:signal transduction histidine kinase/DNA-binding response OmpR family regulator/HPt (histidine-containing phosphotransfer) domain-containing protein